MEQGLISSIDNRERNMNIEQKECLERLKRINKENERKKEAGYLNNRKVDA